MNSHRHDPLRSQLRATLYTEYASNSKDHIEEPDSQGVQLAAVLKYLSQQQASEDWRQVIPNQFEGGAGIRKLLFGAKQDQVTPFEIVFFFFKGFFLENGAGSWRLTAETRRKPVETRRKPVETRRKPAAQPKTSCFLTRS